MSMIPRELVVEKSDAGSRLDHFLMEKVPDLSRSRLQSLIKLESFGNQKCR